MAEPAVAYYDARWGYRDFDARRYEERRYGSLGRRLNHWLLERALTRGLADVAPGSVVLDAPCGTGILTGLLHRLGHKTLAADIGPAMLAVARTRRQDLGLVRADLERPPLRAGAVDAVVSARFLMHLPPSLRPSVLKAMATVASGPVVATVCHPYTLKSGLRALRRLVGFQAKKSPRLTRRELAAEVQAAGLVLERVIPVLPILSEVWVVVLRRPAEPD